MLNDADRSQSRYQDQVPAVARAVWALELLADGEARSLADLSRALGVGASSLLAILTTLRRAGLVTRDAQGRYRLGPGLVALGGAAARHLGVFERFAALADELVERLGDSVLLWVRHDDGYVLAAAREGTRPLRYVPTPGARRPADEGVLGLLEQGARVAEDELLPGIWSVATPLPACREPCAAVIAVAGPPDRLRSPAVRNVLLAVTAGAPVAAVTGGRPARWEHAGPIDATELDAFLRQSLVATLSYLADDGYPTTVPLWYAWDGEAFWLAPRPGSEWAEHVRLDPRVSLAVSESVPPLRRVLTRGRIAEVDDPSGERWSRVEAELSARYAGFDAAREPASAGRRRLLCLTPERLIAWRGLLRHPKLPPLPDAPGAAPWRHLG
jgi:DNA-binding IclR family transcriptional regulator/nitroimidazol reductase NimA-like FMN-containing flavoprotein (pyridoxamine 5'-phosphate oxidase superfamily)